MTLLTRSQRILSLPGVLFCAACWAQTPESGVKPSDVRPPQLRAERNMVGLIDDGIHRQQQRAMHLAEDMEILAQIVREDLAPLFSVPPVAHGFHHGSLVADAEPFLKPLFEYLPDYGVVLQMSIPAPRHTVAAGARRQPSAPEPATRWDQTQRRLRGAASQDQILANDCRTCHAETAAGTPSPPSQDLLIVFLKKTLAEHGRHFRELKPDERVTISLGYAVATTAPAASAAANRTDASPGGADSGPQPDARPGSEPAASPDAAAGSDAQPRNPIDRVILEKWLNKGHAQPSDGDRQRFYERLFLDVLGRVATADELDNLARSGSPEAFDQAVGRLLAAEPNHWHTRYHWHARFAPLDLNGDRSHTAAMFPRHGRIRVSATKSQLDLVGRGKISFAEFGNAVVVETFDPRK